MKPVPAAQSGLRFGRLDFFPVGSNRFSCRPSGQTCTYSTNLYISDKCRHLLINYSSHRSENDFSQNLQEHVKRSSLHRKRLHRSPKAILQRLMLQFFGNEHSDREKFDPSGSAALPSMEEYLPRRENLDYGQFRELEESAVTFIAPE